MSTEYVIALGVELHESSDTVSFSIETQDGFLASPRINADALRAAIIKQIEVLSYLVEDPDEVLARFNVAYGDEQ